MNPLPKETAIEADHIIESTELSSVQHFIAAQWWRRTNFILGLSATIGAVLSAELTTKETEIFWIGALPIAVAIIAALMTFLNPPNSAAGHHAKGVEYQRLFADARMFDKIDRHNIDSDSKLIERIHELSDRKFELDGNSPATPGGIFYLLAKRAVKRGETSFREPDNSDANKDSDGGSTV